MSYSGWGHGRAVSPDTGITAALTAFAARGGMLFGARRWAENPLTMTDVRWQGPDGSSIEAHRQPEDDDALSPIERDAWVQLALHAPLPSVPQSAGRDGQDAPWEQLTLDQAQARELSERLRAMNMQSMQRLAYAPSPPTGSPGSFGSPPPSSAPYSGPLRASDPRPGGNAINRGSGVGPAHGMGGPRAPSMPPRSIPTGGPPSGLHRAPSLMSFEPASPSRPGAAPSPMSQPGVAHEGMNGNGQPYTAAQSSGWGPRASSASADLPEIVVIPCIEVELPPVAPGLSASDYTRDFARDVALHFRRAAEMVAQAREVRGWMRGNRLVLAARMVMARGNRPPGRAEMEGAARLLADALTQRTLPYTRMTFADPREWTQGVPLPE